jgi:hypothetical protein
MVARSVQYRSHATSTEAGEIDMQTNFINEASHVFA